MGRNARAASDTIQTQTDFYQARAFLRSVPEEGFPRAKLIRNPHQPCTFPLDNNNKTPQKSRARPFEGRFLSSPSAPRGSPFSTGGWAVPSGSGSRLAASSAPARALHHPSLSQPCSSTSGTSHRAWEIKATPMRAQSAPHGSSGAGLDSPRGRDGGFCPGSTKEKGWGGLGGSFVLLRGFLIDFSFFPSPGSSFWVPTCPIPT